MSSVKANWFVPEADLEAAFGAPAVLPPARVEEVGVPIRLDGDTAELDARLVELVAAEARLDAEGVSCAIRDRPDTSCSACPIAGQGRRAPLCAVGREQERVCTTLGVQRVGR